jgi:uncharacterized protein YbaP (TraB family)
MVRHPLLWKFTQASATLFVLGSVHVANADMYPLARQIDAAFEAADGLALEIVMDETGQTEAAAKMALAGTLPPGQSLKDAVTSKTYGLVEKHFENEPTSLLAVSRFRPWFVSILLTMSELSRVGFVPELGIDEHFRGRAEKAGKRLSSIETIDDQLALFTGMSKELQEAALAQTIDELDELGPTMKEASLLWQKGDGAALEKLLIEPMRAEYPELFKKLFSDRNVGMSDFAEKDLARPGAHTTLMIVGAGHLIGEKGVIAELERRGHPGTRATPEPPETGAR